jgi:hypothetical protein
MFSCALVFFFSATGITLNHPGWFGGERESVREAKGQIPLKWIARVAGPTNAEALYDGVARLEIVEQLRSEARARGAMKDFIVDETQCMVAFRAPGYTADAFIDRTSGQYDLVESSMGWVAVMNDLHKGRDSGHAWSLVIDVSAVLLALISLSGLILLFYVNRHRKPGLATAVLGIAITLTIYFTLVP